MDKEITYPRFRWYVAIVLAMVTIASAVIMISPAPLVGVISKFYGISVGETTGLLMSSFTLASFFAALIGGAIVDKYGFPAISIGANILIIVGSVLMPSLSGNLTAIVILRIIQGLGSGATVGLVAAVAVRWFPRHERGIVTGIQGMAVSLGVALGFAFIPMALSATGSWAGSFAKS